MSNTDTTQRRNGKWAKVSGARGKWSCAKGWAGNIAASQVQTYPTKDGALIAAQYWLNDA